MRNLALFSAFLLSSLMQTGAAFGDGHAGALHASCAKLERHLMQCESGVRLSPETRAACDRIEQGFRALCGRLGRIYASPSAASAALDLLSEDYEVIPLEEATAPEPVVIGPSDLDDPEAIERLRTAHAVGLTVAITEATEDEARTFHRLIRLGQELDCASPEPRGSEIALYGLQQTRNPAQEASYCLPSLDQDDPASDRRWLRGRFAAMPPTGANPMPLKDDPNQQLISLAKSKNCYFKQNVDGLGNVSWVIEVWAMRNFTDQGFSSNEGADYYLVNFNPTLRAEITGVKEYGVSARRLIDNAGTELDTDFLLLTNLDPDSQTSFVSSYTTDKSTTVDASVGVAASQGEEGLTPNVTLGGSVTVGNSQTVTVPPVTIDNNSDTATGEPTWAFTPQTTAVDTYSPYTAWLWIVGREAYSDGGTSGQVTFNAGANIFATTAGTDFFNPCSVPYPFTAWTVSPPKLIAPLDPSSTSRNGGKFTINGQYLYPGSVTAVLIGGDPVPLNSNVALTSPTEIHVEVPANLDLRPGTYEVGVNTEFNGANRLSNTLPLTLTD